MTKKIYYLILFTLGLLIWSSCGKDKEAEADETIIVFFDAIKEQNFEKAKEKADEQTKKLIVVLEKDVKKYQKIEIKKQEISYEIVERKFEEKKATYKVKIIVGEKERIVTIKLVIVNEVWIISIPPTQIDVLHYVVFYNSYHIIVKEYRRIYIKEKRVIYTKKHKTHKHKTHKHKHKTKKHKKKKRKKTT